MTAFTPADDDVRRAIRERLDENMCVEAGAGTGKTTVLVDRIVNILRTGYARVDELAVITFTEKAAAELAARVRQGLDDAHGSTADEGERARIEAAVRGLNRAHIETIHAFAASLLRERPVEAGLDPGFEMLDELPAQLAFEAAYDEWITRAMAEEPPPPALVDALDLGLRFQLVREAAEVLQRHRDLLPLPASAPEPVDLDGVAQRIGERLAAVRDYSPRPGWEGDAAYVALLAACELTDEMALLAGQPEAVRRLLATADLPSEHVGNQKHWRDGAHCRQVKDAVKAVRGIVAECVGAMRSNATAALVTWLEGFVAFYERRRQTEGKADFDDLLIWARDLVRDGPHVRRAFQSKYRCLLVDEFQDTDPLQVELIVLLCGEADGERDWRRVRPRPGSLFVVGDPKQSIYRFRRADIAMYDDVKRRLFAGAPREIVQNFRSAQPIIEWVNATFGRLFVEREGMQPRYIALHDRPDLPATAGVLRLRGDVAGGSGAGAASAQRRAEADALASLLRREIEGGGWAVRPAGGASTQAAEYRDVAVLVPTRTEIQIYEDALARAGVPHRHEGGRAFFQRQEVRELTSLLRAVDDPSDAIAAVAALRSSAFGCSDEELFAWRAAGHRFDHERVPPDADGPVAEALRSLRDFARRRHAAALPELVRGVLDETRLVEFAMLQPQGEQTAANLLKVIDQARAFAAAGGGGLRGFVRWLKLNVARTADETDASISEETDNVVRILTVHAAKGLEFPVVVFANMAGQRPDRTSVIAERTGARRLHVKLGKLEDGFHTPGFDEGLHLEREHAAAEERRLLYVAATRARDLLVLPFFDGGGSRRRGGTKSLLDWLLEAGADEGDAIDAATLPALEAEQPVWRRPPQAAPEAAVRDLIEEREEWVAWHDTTIDTGAAGAVVVTASALKPEWEPPSASDGDVRRGRAREVGSAVHAALERVDLHGPDALAELARAVADEFGLPERTAEIERVARAALASGAVARALRSPRVLREAPFTVALPLPGGLAEGRIDLLFEEDGEVVVVDFKTDDVKGAEVDARAAAYRTQALVYAWAARAATGLPVREVVFVFARAGVERAMAADASFMAEAEALLRQAGGVGVDAVAP